VVSLSNHFKPFDTLRANGWWQPPISIAMQQSNPFMVSLSNRFKPFDALRANGWWQPPISIAMQQSNPFVVSLSNHFKPFDKAFSPEQSRRVRANGW
jgi:hypothetical protein